MQNDNSSYSPFSFWQEKETFNARLGSWSSFWEGNSLLVKISFFFFAKRETFLFNPRLRACSSLLSFGAGQPESARTMPSPPSSAESQKWWWLWQWWWWCCQEWMVMMIMALDIAFFFFENLRFHPYFNARPFLEGEGVLSWQLLKISSNSFNN